jgi:Mrp family chromosome partitioning ATPase
MSFLPENYSEVEKIYDLTVGMGLKTLAISSVHPGCGATTIAISLAKRNLLSGIRTLVVDMNTQTPSLKPVFAGGEYPYQEHLIKTVEKLKIEDHSQLVCNLTPQLISDGSDSFIVEGVLVPETMHQIMQIRDPKRLHSQIAQWSSDYDFIIFDTSPINKVNSGNVPAAKIIQACDGAIIVSKAGMTTEPQVMQALSKVRSEESNIIGWVVNDQDNPSLKTEIIRQLERFDPWLNWLTSPIKKWLSKSRFLSGAV